MVVSVLVIQDALIAQDSKRWTGSQNSDWNNPANWSPSGVPDKTHEVWIPNATPECHVPSGAIEVRTLTNNGTMHVNNSSFSADIFSNSGQVNVSSALYVSNPRDTWNQCYMSNSGTISATNATVYISANSSLTPYSFHNEGQIETNTFVANCPSVHLQSAGSFTWSKIEGNNVVISVSEGITVGQLSEISGKDNTTGSGGNVTIYAGSMLNNGVIEGGKSGKDGSGGGVSVIASGNVTNNFLASIRGGDSPQTDGAVYVSGRKITNEGTIAGGNSQPSRFEARNAWPVPADKQELFFNHVTLCADTIILRGDSVLVEADTLKMVYNYLRIENVTAYACIWGDVEVDFFGAKNAVTDLTTGNGQGNISVGYGAIRFFSDTVLEAPEGLNYICDLPPLVSPCDTTITGARAAGGFPLTQTGYSGELKVFFQNQSTIPCTIEYAIQDQKGWMQPYSGAFPLMAPLSFDSLVITYEIPVLPDSMPDTIFVNLKPGNAEPIHQAVGFLTPLRLEPIGIREPALVSDSLIEVYPVPFRESLTINATDDVMITIYDETGYVLDRFPAFKGGSIAWLPTPSIGPGVIIIKAINKSGSFAARKVIYKPY